MLLGADQVNIETFCKKIPSRLYGYNQLKMVYVASCILYLIHTRPGVHSFRRFSTDSNIFLEYRAAAYYPRGDGFWGLAVG